MLAPLMRVYPTTPDNKEIVTMSMPHYMFYAPYLTDADIGINPIHIKVRYLLIQASGCSEKERDPMDM